MQWQPSGEPRFHVIRGCKGRDWRAEFSLLAGLSVLTLLLVTLTQWPHSATRAPSYTALSARDAPTAPPFRRASALASAAGTATVMLLYSNTASASTGLRYSHILVPGYGTFATAPACLPYASANVLPAAPTALGPPVVRYSY